MIFNFFYKIETQLESALLSASFLKKDISFKLKKAKIEEICVSKNIFIYFLENFFKENKNFDNRLEIAYKKAKVLDWTNEFELRNYINKFWK